MGYDGLLRSTRISQTKRKAETPTIIPNPHIQPVQGSQPRYLRHGYCSPRILRFISVSDRMQHAPTRSPRRARRKHAVPWGHCYGVLIWRLRDGYQISKAHEHPTSTWALNNYGVCGGELGILLHSALDAISRLQCINREVQQRSFVVESGSLSKASVGCAWRRLRSC